MTNDNLIYETLTYHTAFEDQSIFLEVKKFTTYNTYMELLTYQKYTL
jgi:hypothetical protein